MKPLPALLLIAAGSASPRPTVPLHHLGGGELHHALGRQQQAG